MKILDLAAGTGSSSEPLAAAGADVIVFVGGSIPAYSTNPAAAPAANPNNNARSRERESR